MTSLIPYSTAWIAGTKLAAGSVFFYAAVFVLVNSLEGLIGIVSGVVAGSISLIGFGIDSLIEVTSGAALLWRMSVDADVERRERSERLSLRIVGGCFLALASYVAYEAALDITRKSAPERSVPGIVLACVSLIVMPILSRAKKNVGHAMQRSDLVGKPALRI